MISKGKCTAYSQQGTVVNVSDVFCKKWAKEGLPFDPYRDPIPPVQQQNQQQQLQWLTRCDELAQQQQQYWPLSMRCNGHLLLNAEKMSKSTGGRPRRL